MFYEFKPILEKLYRTMARNFGNIKPLQEDCVSIVTLQSRTLARKEVQMKI